MSAERRAPKKPHQDPSSPGAGLSVAAERAARLSDFLTTEHFTLQTARSATVFETNGRASLFLGTITSAVIALTLMAQVFQVSQPFRVFALVILPVVFFIGLVTIERTLQSSIEDIIYAKAMARIRHYYQHVAPETRSFLTLPVHDDLRTVISAQGVRPSRWQLFLTTAGMVAVVNSVVAGVAVAIGAAQLGVPDGAVIVSGVAGSGFSLAALMWHQRRTWRNEPALRETRFRAPSRGRENGPDRP